MSLPEQIVRQAHTETQATQRRLEVDQLPVQSRAANLLSELKNDVGDLLEIAGIDKSDIVFSDPPPHLQSQDDLAIPMFRAAQKSEGSPDGLASDVSSNFPSPVGSVESVHSSGPYVNVRMDRAGLYNTIVSSVVDNEESLWATDSMHGQRIIVDYGSPNIAKRLGVQHAPTIIAGESLARIYQANSAQVIRANHLGDYGTPFGKTLLGWNMFGDEREYSRDPIGHMHSIYSRVNALAEDDPSVAQSARDEFAQLEAGEPGRVELWQRMREDSLREFSQISAELGTTFDTNIGESFYSRPGLQLVHEMINSGVAEQEEDGSVIFRPYGDGSDPLVLLKQDGATLYGTRDLAAIKHRVESFDPTAIKYVVGEEQSGHFQSLFAAAAAAELAPGIDLEHVQLGLFRSEVGTKISSRDGRGVSLESMLSGVVEDASVGLEGRSKVADEAHLVKAIGYGGLRYSILSTQLGSGATVDGQDISSRAVGSSQYLQYTRARAQKLVDDLGGGRISSSEQGYVFEADDEWSVCRRLLSVPEALQRAGQEDAPQLVASALESIAQAYNTVYQERQLRVSNSEGPLRESRVAMADTVSRTIKDGLSLLGIDAPREM